MSTNDLTESQLAALLRDQVPTQPDGLDGCEPELPDPVRAAARIEEYLSCFGDGVVDVGWNEAGLSPLYARDLETVARAVLRDSREVTPGAPRR